MNPNITPIKHTLRLVAILLTSVLVISGCSKKEVKVDADKYGAARLEASFSSADAPVKAIADKAVAAIKVEDFGKASDTLRELLKESSLSAEQTQAAKDAFAKTSAIPRMTP